jgi:uncharacterized surface protein with fasciclin (FAS1) repeats
MFLGFAVSSVSHAGSQAALGGGSGCEQRNIIEVAESAGSFKTLLAAVSAAGLTETLATTQNLTVFAPTDAAFAQLPEGAVEALLKNIPALQNVLTYHVVGAKVPSKVAVGLTEATMLNGQKVEIRFDGQDLFINESKVIVKDIPAKNGIIHVIDAVLLP